MGKKKMTKFVQQTANQAREYIESSFSEFAHDYIDTTDKGSSTFAGLEKILLHDVEIYGFVLN